MYVVKNTKMWLSVILFMLVFFAIGLYFAGMGLDSDGLGLVFYGSQPHTWAEIFSSTTSNNYNPINASMSVDGMGMYRPLPLLLYTWLVPITGCSAPFYYSFQAFFHALTVSMVFLLIARFYSELSSFWIALAFAFFPSHTPSLTGIASFITISYFLMACIIYMLPLHDNEKNWSWRLVIMLCMYALALFNYEISIIFPIIFGVYAFLFARQRMLLAVPFIGVNILVLLVRFIMFGSGKPPALSITVIISNVVQSLKPLFGLYGLPHWVVLGLIAGLCVCAAYSFVLCGSERRKRMIFYLAAFVLGAWPIFIVNSSSRYYYQAIPFFLLLFYEVFGCIFERLNAKRVLKMVFLPLLTFICFAYTMHALNKRETILAKRDAGLQALQEMYPHTVPQQFFVLGSLFACDENFFIFGSGVMQAMRILFNDPHLPVYHNFEFGYASKGLQLAPIILIPISKGFKFSAQDPGTAWIMFNGAKEGDIIKTTMGQCRVNKVVESWKIIDMDFELDEKYRTAEFLKNTVFLNWASSDWRFVVVDTSHL